MKKNFLAAILLAGMMSVGGTVWAVGGADAAPLAAVMAGFCHRENFDCKSWLRQRSRMKRPSPVPTV